MENKKACLIDEALNGKLQAPHGKSLARKTHKIYTALKMLAEAVKVGTAFWLLLISLAVMCCSLLAFVHQVLPD